MVIGKSQELSAMTIKVALQLPNCHILNHRIIVASFVCKGSTNKKALHFAGLFYLLAVRNGSCIFEDEKYCL
jgi:hypothetical protein